MSKAFTIREYISARLRTKFAVLVLGAAVSASALYFALNYQMNRHQLARSVEMSRQVLTQALEASDLNLATTYLRAAIEQENFYSVELRDNNSGKSILGPATSSQKRYIEICDSKDLGSKFGVGIYACRRLIGFPEIGFGFIALLSLVIVLAGGIRFINGELMALSDRLSGVLDRMSRLGVERLEEIENTGDEQDVAQVKEISDLRRRIVEILANSRELIEQAAAARIEAQVAHDILSPLAALEVATGDVSQLPEKKRLLIRSAVGRIRDIANSLLDKNRALTKRTEADKTSPSIQLLSGLIQSLITEKRLQFRSRSGVDIEARIDAASYGIFAQVQPVEFKRLLSNLINNAVEALGADHGSVQVNLSARQGRALVSVEDNGKGIPPEVLEKLGRRGETYGKAGGSGLGIYHARTSAESWGGSLEIASEVGKGTTTTVNLPQALTPEWFVSELALVAGRAVVILDDDVSIHQVWQGRLDVLKPCEHDVEIVHVSTPEEIRNWVKANEGSARDALYLLDYELLGYEETGLSLAEELVIGDRSILVTNRNEEPGNLEGCRRLKARMIPKGLMGLVPIRVDARLADADRRPRLDAILIDDDPLVRETWEVAADLAKKRLKVFASADDFFQRADSLDRVTPIYIDATLGNASRGEDESRRIHAMGFSEIYLATGQNPDDFSAYAHLRGVVGKSPPWTT